MVTVARGVATIGESAASGALGPLAPAASGFLVLLFGSGAAAAGLLASALAAGAALELGSGWFSASLSSGILRMRVHARDVLLLSQNTYVLGVMAFVEKRKWSVSLVTGPRYALLASMKYQVALVDVDW